MNSTAAGFKLKINKNQSSALENNNKKHRQSLVKSFKSFSPKKNKKLSSLNMSMDTATDFSSNVVKTEFRSQVKALKKKYSGGRLWHMHMAGPGSYDLPPLFGSNNHDSSKFNNPRYSMGREDRETIKVLSKEQAAALKGRFAPGVGRYSPDVTKTFNEEKLRY